MQEIKTTCPYCGVGCGIIASVDANGLVNIKGDPDHPANHGRLCSKGAALAETVNYDERLLYPVVRGEQCGWEQAVAEVAGGLRKIIDRHGPDAVAFYVSGQLLTEDYYVANKLMKGFIGSANIDTNSRLCMSSSVAGHKRAFGADAVPCCYEDLERAKLVVLAGSNAAWCHPVLFQRIRKARKENPDLLVVVIDPRQTDTCDIADLHLSLTPGTDAWLFNGLLCHLEDQGEVNALFAGAHARGMSEALQAARQSSPDIQTTASRCGLDAGRVAEFFRLFARTERVVTVYSQGINQSTSGSDKVNAIINCHLLTGRIGRPGMGPFSFTGQPNAMGGREVGGLANQLAAHMELDDPEHRRIVQSFWDSPQVPDKPGLKAVDMIRAVEDGRIRAIWIMGTNPVVSQPEADRVRQALAGCELVVVSDCMQSTDTVDLAHIRLPALTWGERAGTVTNSERRISRQRAFIGAPGMARPDWWIICQVARAMGFGHAFDYRVPAQIFREHARLSGQGNHGRRAFDISGLADISDAEYDALNPVQWPVNKAHPGGCARLFSDGRFFTRDGKAAFVAVSPREPAGRTEKNYSMIMNTGRLRDQWHTMTRTGKSPRLSSHDIEPAVTLHPDDALRQGIGDGQLCKVSSRLASLVARARLSRRQPAGSLFVPMHWNDHFASQARVSALIAANLDPVSGQPEFKHMPVAVTPYRPAWQGFLLSRRHLQLDGIAYWARSRGRGLWRYELAGEQAPQDWAECARNFLCGSDESVEWIEFFDSGQQRYRAARLVNGGLESCIFIGPDHVLPPRDWLVSLFSAEALDREARTALLTGKPPVGQKDAGRTVCACLNVGVNTLIEAIRQQGLETPEAIGEALGAGTNCGSCIPEIRRLIAQVSTRKPGFPGGWK